jgi:isopentenyl phosphate kinase
MKNYQSKIQKLQFLKLGGSLITDKVNPHTPRLEVISRLACEILSVYEQNPDLQLVLGHGSGSFGHVPAKKFGTREGVQSQKQWMGFVEVWREAASLNHLVLDALKEAGIPAIVFPPSSCITAADGRVDTWDLYPLKSALKSGLLPVVYGDTVFDNFRGGTILSTEDLFSFLAVELNPSRILLAGIEPGVWGDYPVCERLITDIHPGNIDVIAPSLGGSSAADVTGGMLSKVRQSLELVQQVPGLQVQIFSGEDLNNVGKVLRGAYKGTMIRA